jgi:pimeloyl-ACP methyl ester carboxylesterase
MSSQPLHHYLPHDDGRLHVLEWPSNGPTIICQHYMWTTADVWADLFDALGGRFRVLSIDAPGHGESDPLGLEDRARVMLGVLDALVDGPAIFVGASNGAFRSTSFALMHPERVKRLILVEPPVLAKATSRDNERQRMSALPEAPKSLDELYSAYREFIYRFADPELLRTFLRRTWKSVDGVWKQRLSISELPEEANGIVFTPQVFGGLRMPVLVIGAQSSKLCGPEGAALLKAVIEDSSTECLPDCGHIVHINQPTRLHQAILDFCRPELAA